MPQERPMNRSKFILGLICHLACISPALCCNVPVFRFALERWKPDHYQVLLLHRDELTKEQHGLLSDWESVQERKLSNAQLTLIDLQKTAPENKKYAALTANQDQPKIALFYPPALKIEEALWTAPLSGTALKQLDDSPLRRELVNRLVQGQTAVWLLVESGNATKDQAAETLLAAELKRLEQELKLPVLTDAPEDQLVGGPPLAVKFSVLRIPPAKEEEVFRQMLLNCEPDILRRQEPLVYPVFGRGRSLLPIIGAGIIADNIQEYAEFLVGACSCEIKEQNPGFDLVLAADWDALLKEQGYKPVAISSKDPLPVELENVTIPPGSAEVGSGAVQSKAKHVSSEHITPKQPAPLDVADPPGQLKWYAGIGLTAILGLGIALRIISRRAMPS